MDDDYQSYLASDQVYQRTNMPTVGSTSNGTGIRGLNALVSDPAFVSAASPIRDQMFEDWLKTDLPQIIANVPENQKPAQIAKARQLYAQMVAQPEKAGMLRTVSDDAITFANAIGDTFASGIRAISPENSVSAGINNATTWARQNLLSQQAQEEALARQQRRERADGVLGTLGAEYQNIKEAPLAYAAELTGRAAPIVAASALASAAAPVVGIGAAAAGTAAGLGAGALTGVGDIRGLRADQARTLPFETLMQSPEVQDLARKGYNEQQIRDYLANEVGWQEGAAAVANALPGGAIGHLAARPATGSLVGKVLSGPVGRTLSGRTGSAIENAALGAVGGGVEGGASGTIQAQYNPATSWQKNATSGAVLGAVSGGILGTAFGGRSHINDATDNTPSSSDTTNSTVPPAAEATPTADTSATPAASTSQAAPTADTSVAPTTSATGEAAAPSSGATKKPKAATPRSYASYIAMNFQAVDGAFPFDTWAQTIARKPKETNEQYLDRILTGLDKVRNYTEQRKVNRDFTEYAKGRTIENISNQEVDAATNTFRNYIQESLANGAKTPDEVGAFITSKLDGLSQQSKNVLLRSGTVKDIASSLTDAFADTGSVQRILEIANKAFNDGTTTDTTAGTSAATGLTTPPPEPVRNTATPVDTGNNPATGAGGETTVSSGDSGSNPPAATGATTSDGTVVTQGNNAAPNGNQSVAAAKPVQRKGRGSRNTSGAEVAPTVDAGADTGEPTSAVTSPVSAEQDGSASTAAVRPEPVQGAGSDANPQATGQRSSGRSKSAGNTRAVVKRATPEKAVATTKRKNAATAARTTVRKSTRSKKSSSATEELNSRIGKLPPKQKEALDKAATENKAQSTSEFVQQAYASKLTKDKTLWSSLTATVKRAINNIMKGLAIALAAVSFYHMKPIDVYANDFYAGRHVIEDVIDPSVNSANSWVLENGANKGEKYVLADTINHDLYVMNPDGSLVRKVPMMADGSTPAKEPHVVQATDGSGRVGVTELQVDAKNVAPVDNHGLVGDAISLPKDVIRDLGNNFDGRVFEIADAQSDQAQLTNADADANTANQIGGLAAAALPFGFLVGRKRKTGNLPEGEDGASNFDSSDSAKPSSSTSPATSNIAPEDIARAEAVKNSPNWKTLSKRQKAAADMTPPSDAEVTAELGKGIPGAATAVRQVKNFYKKVLDYTDKTESRKFRSPASVDELIDFAQTGELPKATPQSRGLTTISKIKTVLNDAMEPLFAATHHSESVQRDFAVGRNKYNAHYTALKESVGRLLNQASVIGRKFGYSPRKTWDMLNTYTRGYVADDMNKATYARYQRTIKRITAEIPEIKKAIQNDEEGAIGRLDRALKELEEAKLWTQDYRKYNNVVRKELPLDAEADARKARFAGGITSAEARAILNGKEIAALAPEFKPIVDEMLGFIREAVDAAVKAGVMSEEEAREYIANGKYVPTTGHMDADTSIPNAISWMGRTDRTRDGRISLADNPVMTIVAKAANIHYRADMANFYNNLLQHGKDWGFTVRRSSAETPPEGMVMVTRAEQRKDGTGVTQRYIIGNDDNPEAMSALTGRNIRYQTNAVLRRAAQWTFGFSYLVTRAVLAFAFPNGFRDIGERATNIYAQNINHVNVKPGMLTVDAYKYYAPSIKTAFKYLQMRGRGEEIPATGDIANLHRLFQEGGVMTRNTALRNSLEGHISQMRPLNRFLGGVHKTYDMLNLWNETFETAASYSIYRALRKQGVDEANAAATTLQAMDLNQRGTAAPFLNVLYPFFSTRMAGAANIARSLSTLRGKALFATQVAGAIALYSLAEALAGDEKDEAGNNAIDQLTDTQIARSIPLFTGSGILRIPVPYGLPYIAWNLGTAIVRYKNGRQNGRESAEQVLQSVIDETVPAGSPPPVSISQDPFFYAVTTMTPQFLRNFMNIAAGKNDFGQTLNKPYMDATVPRYMQGKTSTEDFWKTAATYVGPIKDMTPEEVRELARFIIPPISSIVRDMEEGFNDEGTPMVAGAAQVLGIPRLYTQQKNALNNVYFPALARAQQLQQSYVAKYGKIPTAEESGIRSAQDRHEMWLQQIPMSAHDENIIRALFDNETMRAKSGQYKMDDDDIKRIFLRQVGNAI